MSASSAKENILNKIRLALTQATPIPFPDIQEDTFPFQPLQQDIVVEFAEQFSALQGRFSYCQNEQELMVQLDNLIKQCQWKNIYCAEEILPLLLSSDTITTDIVNCDVAITGCEALVARTGSVLLTARNSGRIPSVYAPVHICIAYTSQLVYDIKDALVQLKEKYGNSLPSLITFATGPSRTADIEKTLVVGVHGPKEVFCFLIDA